MKGIQIAAPFKLNHKPIDTRYIVNTLEELNNINGYLGLVTYCIEDNTRYIWRNEWISEYKVRDDLKQEKDAGIHIFNWDELTSNVYEEIENLKKIAKKDIIICVNYNGAILPASYTSNSIIAIHNTSPLTYTALIYTDKPSVTNINLSTAEELAETNQLLSILTARVGTNEATSVYSVDFTNAFNFYNKSKSLIHSIPIENLEFRLAYKENTGIIQLFSKDVLLTEIDTNDEKILKSSRFDSETEELVLEFYGTNTDDEGNEVNNVVRIPLSTISDKIKYYTSEDRYIVLNSTGTDTDQKNNTNEFTLSEYVKDAIDNRLPALEENLSNEVNRSINEDNRLDEKITNETSRAITRENEIEENTNSRVSKSGDTMTGLLTAHSVDVVNDIKPTVDNNSDLGSSDNKFKNIYLAGAIGNGNYSVEVTNIAKKSILDQEILDRQNDVKTLTDNLNTTNVNLNTEANTRATNDQAILDRFNTSINSYSVVSEDNYSKLKFSLGDTNYSKDIIGINIEHFDTIDFSTNKKLTLNTNFLATLAYKTDQDNIAARVATNESDIARIDKVKVAPYYGTVEGLLEELANRSISIGTYRLVSDTKSTHDILTNDMLAVFIVYDEGGNRYIKCSNGIIDSTGTFIVDNYLRRTGGTVTGDTTFTNISLNSITGTAGNISTITSDTVNATKINTDTIIGTNGRLTYNGSNLAFQNDLNNYLLLTGGKLTGNLEIPSLSFTDGINISADGLELFKSNSLGVELGANRTDSYMYLYSSDRPMWVKGGANDISEYFVMESDLESYVQNTDAAIANSLTVPTTNIQLLHLGNIYKNIFNVTELNATAIYTIYTGLDFAEDMYYHINLSGSLKSMHTAIGLDITFNIYDGQILSPRVSSYSGFRPDVYIYNSNGKIGLTLSMPDASSMNGLYLSASVEANNEISLDPWSISTNVSLPAVNHVDSVKATYNSVINKLSINGVVFDGTSDKSYDIITTEYLSDNYYNKDDILGLGYLTITNAASIYVPKTGATMSGNLSSPVLKGNIYVNTPSIVNQDNNGTYENRLDLGDSLNGFKAYSTQGQYDFYYNDGTDLDTAKNLFNVNKSSITYLDKNIAHESNIDNDTIVYENVFKLGSSYVEKINKAVKGAIIDHVAATSDVLAHTKANLQLNDESTLEIELFKYSNNLTFNVDDDDNEYLDLSDSFKATIDAKLDSTVAASTYQPKGNYSTKENTIKNISLNGDTENTISINLEHEDSSLDTILRILEVGKYLTYSGNTLNVSDTLITDSLTGVFKSAQIIDNNIVFKDINNSEVGSISITNIGLNIDYSNGSLKLLDNLGNVISDTEIQLESIVSEAEFDTDSNAIIITFSNDSSISIPIRTFSEAFPIYLESDTIDIVSSESGNVRTNIIKLKDEYRDRINNAVQASDLINYYTSAESDNRFIQKNSQLDLSGINLTTGKIVRGSNGVDIISNQINISPDIDNNNYDVRFIRGAIVPGLSNSVNIGTSVYKFKNIYVSKFNDIDASKIVTTDILKDYATVNGGNLINKVITNPVINNDRITSDITNVDYNTYSTNVHMKSAYYQDSLLVGKKLFANSLTGTVKSATGLLTTTLALNPNTNHKVIINDTELGDSYKTAGLTVYANEVVNGYMLNNLYTVLNNNKQNNIENYIVVASVDEINNKLVLTTNKNKSVTYSVNVATDEIVGTVKPGQTLDVSEDGTLNIAPDIEEYMVRTDKNNKFTGSQTFNDIDVDNIDANNIMINGKRLDDIYALKASLADIYIPKGAVENYTDLPSEGNDVGFVYTVINEFSIDEDTNNIQAGSYISGTSFVWTHSQKWVSIGSLLNIQGLLSNADAEEKYLSKVDAEILYASKDEAAENLTEAEADLKYAQINDIPTNIEYVYNESLKTLSFNILSNTSILDKEY